MATDMDRDEAGDREAFRQGLEGFRGSGLARPEQAHVTRFMRGTMRLASAGEYATLDDAIATLDPAALHELAILSVLRTVYTSRQVLPAWVAFRDAAADALEARGLPYEKLMMGLFTPEGDRMADADAVRADPAAAFAASWGGLVEAGREGFGRPHFDRAMYALRLLLARGGHALVDAALAAADPESLADQAGICLLRGCRAERERLPSWEAFRDRVCDFHHRRGLGATRLLKDLGWASPEPGPAGPV